jgi:hypothetical protein
MTIFFIIILHCMKNYCQNLLLLFYPLLPALGYAVPTYAFSRQTRSKLKTRMLHPSSSILTRRLWDICLKKYIKIWTNKRGTLHRFLPLFNHRKQRVCILSTCSHAYGRESEENFKLYRLWHTLTQLFMLIIRAWTCKIIIRPSRLGFLLDIYSNLKWNFGL